MPSYNVKYNDKWACFSSISDGFITPFMEESEYDKWYKMTYNTTKTSYVRNEMSIMEAILNISLNRTYKDALNCFMECGLPKDVCEKLFYDMQVKYYKPIHIEKKLYKCPNCGTMIKENTKKCPKQMCNIQFFWE